MRKRLRSHLAPVLGVVSVLLLLTWCRSNAGCDSIIVKKGGVLWQVCLEDGRLSVDREIVAQTGLSLWYERMACMVTLSRGWVKYRRGPGWKHVEVSFWLIIAPFPLAALVARLRYGASPRRWGRYTLPVAWAGWPVLLVLAQGDLYAVPELIVLLGICALGAWVVLIWFDAVMHRTDPRPPPWHFRERKWFDRIARGLCPVCGYDVRASAERCSECGARRYHKSELRDERWLSGYIDATDAGNQTTGASHRR